VRQRVEAKGWDGNLLIAGLKRLPRSLPQPHRWMLLKLHMNAPMMSSRYSAAGIEVGDVHCSFCGVGEDSVAHVTRCPAVMAAYDGVAVLAALPPLTDIRAALMMQQEYDGASFSGMLAFFAAALDIKAMCHRGVHFGDHSELVTLVWTSMQCPWLMRCSPTKDKKARRASRVREPEPVPDTVIYRSDGACRGQ